MYLKIIFLIRRVQSQFNRQLNLIIHSSSYIIINYMQGQQQEMFLRTIYNHDQYTSQIKPILEDLSHCKYTFRLILKKYQLFQYLTWAQRSTKLSKKNFHTQLSLKILQKDKGFPSITALIAQFMLKQEKKQYKIPIILSGKAQEQVYTKRTFVLLLCHMALMLIPIQPYHQIYKLQPNFSAVKDFSFIFDNQKYKTQCILQYLRQVLPEMLKQQNTISDQKLLIRRLVTQQSIEQIIRLNKDLPMMPLTMDGDNASIEEYNGQLKVDFANKYIGGGALFSGCVQQQIMFANRPQLYVTQLLCEKMRANQAIQLVGFKKFFVNNGYGWNASYGGREKTTYTIKDNIAQEYITAIDALHFYDKNSPEQFKQTSLKREILKAYIGFATPQKNKVITGNWGCGAFQGNHQLKLLIQWVAASINGKQMIYCPFGYRHQLQNKTIMERMSKMRVGQAYSLLVKCCEEFTTVQDVKDKKVYNVLENLLS